MKDLRAPDPLSEPVGRTSSATGTMSLRDEVLRLRDENERLRRGLREIGELLDASSRTQPSTPTRMLPAIGLL
jgi:hypothetical protein